MGRGKGGKEEGRERNPKASHQDQVNLWGLAASAVAQQHHAFSILR